LPKVASKSSEQLVRVKTDNNKSLATLDLLKRSNRNSQALEKIVEKPSKPVKQATSGEDDKTCENDKFK